MWVQVPPSVLISTMYPVITAPGSTSARPHQDPAQSASNAPCAFSRSFCPPEVAQHDTCRQGHLLSTPGPPRHFFLSFLRFSIVTNYCTYTLYLLTITKATTNIVERCENVPQKPRFSPNAGFAIRPSPPILMRWPCRPPYPTPSSATRNWVRLACVICYGMLRFPAFLKFWEPRFSTQVLNE